MENKSYNSSIAVPVSAGEVIKKISNVAGWWGITLSGSAEKVNDKFVVKMGEEAFFNMTVTELTPGKRLVWSIGDSYMPWYTDKHEWSSTRLIFDLAENNGLTDVTFTHEGLTPDAECYKDCEPGWSHWIKTSLYTYLTTGKGVFRKPTK